MIVRLILIGWLAFAVGPSVSADSGQGEAQRAFEQMKSLVGQWRRENAPESKLGIEFKLLANDSVLVETWSSAGEPYSLTIYHLDKDDLVATHYCPQGNQPRLKLVKGQAGAVLRFKFWDATNLPDISKSHQTALSFELTEGASLLRRGETYTEAGVGDASELLLKKVG